MRILPLTVGSCLVLPLCLTVSAWSQLTYTVRVIDRSEPGSPLKISGTTSFTEQVFANSVTSTSDFRVAARNMSDKGIILLLADFDEAGPHGAGTHHVIQIDHFFWGEIGPRQSFEFTRSRPGRRMSACCKTPLTPAAEPKAEVRVRYIQFADGSTFGNEMTAEDAFGDRRAIREVLVRLDNLSNDRDFLRLLAQKIQPWGADDFLAVFRRTAKTHGTATVRNQVHAAIATAEAHRAAMEVVQAER
jgi:hypothetical protein